MTGITGRRPRVKLSHNEIMRRLRLGDVRKLLRDRCGSVLPDDDAGREYLLELLLPISSGPNEAVKRCRAIEIWGPTDRMLHEIERWAPWMSEDEARELRLDINGMPAWQRKPMARTLGERLQVTYSERARLGLRTIGPCDMTEAGMALIRKQKRRQRDKLRRQRQPRAEYLANHTKSKEQPWTLRGESRATYYRRIKQEQARETGVHHINLIKTERILVSQEKTEANVGLCERLPTPTPAGQVQTYAKLLGPWIPVSEVDWLGYTPDLIAYVAAGMDAICLPPEIPPDDVAVAA